MHNDVDPLRDIEVINLELVLADKEQHQSCEGLNATKGTEIKRSLLSAMCCAKSCLL